MNRATGHRLVWNNVTALLMGFSCLQARCAPQMSQLTLGLSDLIIQQPKTQTIVTELTSEDRILLPIDALLTNTSSHTVHNFSHKQPLFPTSCTLVSLGHSVSYATPTHFRFLLQQNMENCDWAQPLRSDTLVCCLGVVLKISCNTVL